MTILLVLVLLALVVQQADFGGGGYFAGRGCWLPEGERRSNSRLVDGVLLVDPKLHLLLVIGADSGARDWRLVVSL